MHAAAGRGRLRVISRRDGHSVAIEVSDDGPGIPPEHLSKLFDPFFTTKPAGVGTGLGLAISRRIARGHGGELTVRSQVGQGATFTLRLPASAAPAGAVAREPRASGAFRAPGSTLSVLVIDDEPAIRRSVERLLIRRGHQVVTAGEPAGAQAALARQSWDVVLCDVHLGRHSGIELYERAAAERPELADRFIMMTGDLLSPEVVEFLARTRARHLGKPFEAQVLITEVEHAALATAAA
jgi:two-component system NtrC family sensor kinase